MTATPARIGDRFRFTYPERDKQFNRELTVERVLGDGPDDLVFFNDGTHSKQKHLANPGVDFQGACGSCIAAFSIEKLA